MNHKLTWQGRPTLLLQPWRLGELLTYKYTLFLFEKPKMRQFNEDGQSAMIFMCSRQLEKNSTINENLGKNMWTSVVLEFQLPVCIVPIQSLRPFPTDFQTRALSMFAPASTNQVYLHSIFCLLDYFLFYIISLRF